MKIGFRRIRGHNSGRRHGRGGRHGVAVEGDAREKELMARWFMRLELSKMGRPISRYFGPGQTYKS